MIYHKIKPILLLFILFIIVSSVYGDDYEPQTWMYNVNKSEDALIDLKNSHINIDYEDKTITLPKYPLPNASDFMPGNTYNYAVLKSKGEGQEEGAYQYVFDGNEMIEVGNLKVQIDNPLAIAASTIQHSMMVSSIAEDGSNEISNYILEQGKMIRNTVLSISGLQQIYSMATFKSTGDLAVLHKDEMNFYSMSDSNIVKIPRIQVNNVKDPIAVATANEYNFAVLERTGLKWYAFNGEGISQIPAMSLAFDDNIKNPKALAISNDTAYILNDKQVNAYKLDNDELKLIEHSAFSYTKDLVMPYTITLSENCSDYIVLDGIEGSKEDFRLRYFMYNGEEMVENNSLGMQLKLVVAGIWYYKEGELITNVQETSADFADFVRVKAYCEVPEDTEIIFYVANEGEEIEDVKWYESWRIRNPEGAKILEKAYRNKDGDVEWESYGEINRSYPSYNDVVNIDYPIIDDNNIDIKEDENGNIIINPINESIEPNLWTSIPISRDENNKYNKIRIKAVFKTDKTEVSPKIFMPIGTNNEENISIENQPAIKWQANASPNPVIIDEIDNGHGDKDNPEFEQVDSWIYTTTPTFTWSFSDPDGNNDKQTYSQLIVLYKSEFDEWKVAYVSPRQEGNENSIRLVEGVLYSNNTYEFVAGIRAWDSQGAASRFKITESFKVLAFERIRISNIINPPENSELGIMMAPKSNDYGSHFLIKENMKEDELPYAKAGAQITMLIDSVGPIETIAEEISKIYFIDNDGNEIDVCFGECESYKEPDSFIENNIYRINFWTKAPIKYVPDNTLILMKLIGESSIGGTTVFYIPPYADGIVLTKDTIYHDWHVVLEGSDK